MNPDTIEDFKLPEYAAYKSDLESLDNFDFKSLSAKEIYHKIYDCIKILPLNHGILNPERFNKLKFYRARLNINTDKEDISLISTYSFPPLSACSENGRANLASKSVFYCSDDIQASILECKPKLNDVGFLSFWKGIAEKPIKCGIFLPPDLPEQNNWNLMAQDSFESYANYFKEKNLNYNKHFLLLSRFVNHKFINEKKPYYLTSMISNEMLYNNEYKDFFVYPSTLAQSKLCNMAFHPNSVLENLKFEKVIKFKVNNIENGVVHFNLGKVGQLEGTKMIWKDHTEEETKLFNKIL